ncbi:hypothetical protein [Streptomyces roseolilacinus]|uniref:Uncharacterized protein n=1 Tax=Streptomyces roseolilacinus TaxID=66904 RepID=A0A918ELA1_9ACTN|nr:hypothetical protein [Streptomyces roseolilacinus]GGQ22549.1 hypothetical protein GCM10010249_46430 [Streptomyces roseolilacinus]
MAVRAVPRAVQPGRARTGAAGGRSGAPSAGAPPRAVRDVAPRDPGPPTTAAARVRPGAAAALRKDTAQ